jgi:hypothetical protein
LQDSLVEQQQQQQQQQISAQNKINFVSQPKHSPPMNTFHAAPQTHHYPPGLKLNNSNNAALNIPVNFTQASQTPQHSNVPPHFQQSVYPSAVQQPQYPQNMPTNIQNLQDIEQKTTALVQSQPMPSTQKPPSREDESRTSSVAPFEKEKSRNNNTNNNEWNGQQPPQIDTWTNETSIERNGGQGGNFSRFNRNRGNPGNPKYNNYR